MMIADHEVSLQLSSVTLFIPFTPLCSGREPEKLAYITKYLKAVGMYRDYNDASQDPDFTKVSLDMK